jgi:hypothetical protein
MKKPTRERSASVLPSWVGILGDSGPRYRGRATGVMGEHGQGFLVDVPGVIG